MKVRNSLKSLRSRHRDNRVVRRKAPRGVGQDHVLVEIEKVEQAAAGSVKQALTPHRDGDDQRNGSR